MEPDNRPCYHLLLIVERQVRLYHSRPLHPNRTVPLTTVSEIIQTQLRSNLLSVYFDIRMTEHDPGLCAAHQRSWSDLQKNKTKNRATCGKIESSEHFDNNTVVWLPLFNHWGDEAWPHIFGLSTFELLRFCQTSVWFFFFFYKLVFSLSALAANLYFFKPQLKRFNFCITTGADWEGDLASSSGSYSHRCFGLFLFKDQCVESPYYYYYYFIYINHWTNKHSK